MGGSMGPVPQLVSISISPLALAPWEQCFKAMQLLSGEVCSGHKPRTAQATQAAWSFALLRVSPGGLDTRRAAKGGGGELSVSGGAGLGGGASAVLAAGQVHLVTFRCPVLATLLTQ